MSSARTLLALTLLMAPLAGPAAGGPEGRIAQEARIADVLGLADAAHGRFDPREEYRILQHAATLPGAAADVALVQRRLALIEWRILGLYDEARQRLRAAASGFRAAEAWLALVRLELAADDPVAAQTAADQALLAADSPRVRDLAQRAFFRAVVARAVAQRRAGEEISRASVEWVRDELRGMVSAAPGELEPSRLLLRAALLTDDGPTALAALQSYFHLFTGAPAPSAIRTAVAELEPRLPDLTPDDTDSEARVALAIGLQGVRLIQEAALVALDPRLPATVRDAEPIGSMLRYEAAVRELRAAVRAYYRQTILGSYRPERLDEAVARFVSDVWSGAHGTYEPLPPIDDGLAWLRQRYGAVLRLARTSRLADLVMGHAIVDDPHRVEQGGRSADVRFAVLDNMVSRGFRDWAWEHRSGARGYGSMDGILQIRQDYVADALRAWALVHDPSRRAAHERRIARESELDHQRARQNPYAYLPGLGLRLQHQGHLAILEQLATAGLEGARLRGAFLLAVQQSMRTSSILAHEGRHVLDLSERVRYHREFAAKLAEVARAPHPRIAFSGIIDPSIGDGTFHGTGNLMVMQRLVDWIEANQHAIAGLAPSLPWLPQLDRLTDDQLRRACAELDPYEAS